MNSIPEHESDRGYFLIPLISFLVLLAYELCVGKFIFAQGREFVIRHAVLAQAIGYVERVILLAPIVWLLVRRDISFGSIGLKLNWRDAGLLAGLGVNVLFSAAIVTLLAVKAPAGKSFQDIYAGWWSSLITILVVAFTEEAFFRGILQALFQRALKKPALSILLSAAAFGLFHIAYLWIPVLGLNAVLFSFGVGLVFAVLYHFTKNLWWCFWLHFLLDFKMPLFGLLTLLGVKY